MNTHNAQGRVLLRAETDEGIVVERLELSYDDYYSDGTPLVDSNAYRAQRGIRRLKGEIFGSGGNLLQSFENQYSVDGRYMHGRTVHEDGTVVVD